MKIIANHAHVFQPEVKKEGTIEALKELMEVCGIDKAVCFAPFDKQFISNGDNPNQWLYEQIKNDDDLLGFGTIDFTKKIYENRLRKFIFWV